MRVICCQHPVEWENKPANFSAVENLFQRDRPPAGSLVLLPEMFATGFSMNVPAIAEVDDRPTEKFLSRLAREHRIHLLGGLVTMDASGRGRNQAVVFGPDGGEVVRYQKMHPFTPGGESDRYAAGKSPVTFQWSGMVVAPFICYDLRFPESFRRVAATARPQLFVVIASWPEMRASHWTKLLQARAIENQAFVAGVNRCGTDPQFRYLGGSLIANPHGEIIAQAGSAEEMIGAELDIAALEGYREKLPFLDDLRSAG